MTTDPHLKRRLLTSAAWLALWVLLTAWACYKLAMAWPYVQSVPQLVLVFSLPGILFRATDLTHIGIRRQPLAGKWRWLARVVCVLAGLLTAVHLWVALDEISMARFERAMAPLVNRLHANAATPCPPGGRYPVDAGMTAYLIESGASNTPPAELHHGHARFVLALPGRSIDIDGSTMFYQSATRQWKKVHNDQLAQTGELQTLIRDLEICKIPLR